MKRTIKIFALCFSLATVNANAGWPVVVDGQPLPSLAPMLEKTTPGVVSISVEGTHKISQRSDIFRYFFGPGVPKRNEQEQPFEGLGSGVIIDAKEGYVVTNNHVVDNADRITISLKDGREYSAKKIGYDEQTDIALLQIEAKDLIQVKIANSDQLRVGDFVVAIGNPFGLSQTVTTGIVSALGRSGLNIEELENFIQTDAAINRGNSGGALVNLRGELIGINTAIAGPSGGSVGIGFAIPSNMMKNLVDQIIQFGEVRRGLLGISGDNVDADLAKAMNLSSRKGAFVNSVSQDSAAEKGGVQPGDIIVSVNGRPISNFPELRARISTMGAGAEVRLGLLRNGEELDVTVILQQSVQVQAVAEDIHEQLLGAVLSNTSNGRGVVISDIEQGSPAHLIGLRKDDVIIGVNRETVDSITDFKRIMDDIDGVIAIQIMRGRTPSYIIIR